MKSKLLWAALAAASLSAVALLFVAPDVFGGLKQKVTLDRATAFHRAADLSGRFGLGPTDAQEALGYTNDDAAQAFIEWKGGGLEKLNQAAQQGLYNPARWTVRHFREQQILEASFFFSPSGAFLGWSEKHPDQEALPNLDESVARSLAAKTASDSGVVDLGLWTPAESSQVTQPGGRIDRTFVWEKTPSPFGDARLLWTAVVSGNRVTSLEPSLKVPDAFQRWYDNERSTNTLIATLSVAGMGVLLLLAVIEVFKLGRRKEVAWKRSWIVGAVLALGATAAQINNLGGAWMTYSTALSTGVFWTTQIVILALTLVLSTLLFGLSLAGADAVFRRAFPQFLSLGRPFGLASIAPASLLRQTAGAYLTVPLWLLYAVGFYLVTKSAWGWWTPAAAMTDPNIVGQFIPWLTPLGNATQAAVWEELFFRALPLSLAVLAGRKWGRPKLWISVALVAQAVVFAAGHATYPGLPGWSRLVELLLPAFAFGLIQLRWGLLPAVLLHFGYDFVLMSQPIFTTDSPSLIPDRIAVVLVVLTIPAVAVWNRYFRKPKGANETFGADVSVEGPPPSHAEPSKKEVARSRLPALALAILALAGALAWVLTLQKPTNPLTLDRQTAQRVAERTLVDAGVKIPSTWTLDVISANGGGDDNRLALSKGGPALVEALTKKGYLPPSRWIFQWSDFTGDVKNRERRTVSVASGDRAFRIYHGIPEGKPGKTLPQADARAVALAALQDRFGVSDPPDLKAAIETKQPARSDWNFDFEAAADSVPGVSARIHVAVSGDEVTDAYRYVYLPEDWARNWQNRSSLTTILAVVLGMGLFAFIGWGVVRGFRSWSRKEASLAAFVTVASTLTLAFTLVYFNGWSNQTVNFNLAEPWGTQALTQALLVPAGFLLLGLLWGLVSAGVFPKSPVWSAFQKRDLLLGLASGLALSGALGALAKIAPMGTSFVPAVDAAAAWLPLATPVLNAMTAVLLVSLPAIFVLERADALESRGKLVWSLLLIFAAGAAFHFGMPVDTPESLLYRSLGSGLVAMGLWLLLRGRPGLFALAWAVVATLGSVETLVWQPYPDAWIGTLVGMAVSVGSGVLVARLTAPAAPPP